MLPKKPVHTIRTTKNSIRRVLVLPDTQGPYVDESLYAVECMMADEKWSEIVHVGDFADFDCISTHNVNRLKTIEGKTLQADFDWGNATIDRWHKRSRGAKMTFIEGNHCFRLTRYIDANPQLSGVIEFPKVFKFKQRGVNWVPYWSKGTHYNIGNAYFIHGQYTSEHHAKKHVMRWGVNLFYGHLHDTQCFPLVLRGEDKTIVGQSLGCLCDYNQSYLQGRPTNWQQAFAVFDFFPNGYFTYNLVRIFQHRFSFEGQVYEGTPSDRAIVLAAS